MRKFGFREDKKNSFRDKRKQKLIQQVVTIAETSYVDCFFSRDSMLLIGEINLMFRLHSDNLETALVEKFCW